MASVDFASKKISFDNLLSLVNSLAASIYVVDRDLLIEWANMRALEWLGKKDLSEVRGKHCHEEVFGRGEPCEDCPALKTFESGRTETVEMQVEQGTRSRHYSLVATPMVKKGERTFSHVIEMAQDVTAQRRAEEERLRLSEFNKAIIDNAPVAIFTLDTNGIFTSVNPTLASMSGLGGKAAEKLLGFNWLTNGHTVKCGLAAYMKKALQGEPFELHDFPFITFRGDRSNYLDFKGVPLRGKSGEVEGLLCIIEETTERVKTRVQLIQEAKMSAVGRLATGVAHELNNPLATVAAHSELALELLQSDGDNLRKGELEELRGYLEVIQEYSFRCKNIITHLFDLSHRGFTMAAIDVHELLRDLLDSMPGRARKVRFVREFAAHAPLVEGDMGALRQVFLNLIHNALDAVEDKGHPTVWIRTRSADYGHVVVEIEDNGVGIPQDKIDKIFDPFYTTKGARKGIGIGLTLCFEFLNRVAGKIEVESKTGEGTLFRVLLPPNHAAGAE